MIEDETDEDYDLLSGFPCDHADYDVDILTGRASCNFCSHGWYVSEDQILRQIEHERAYNEYLDRENRRQWWRELFAPILNWRWRFQKWRWSRQKTITDDDIPF